MYKNKILTILRRFYSQLQLLCKGNLKLLIFWILLILSSSLFPVFQIMLQKKSINLISNINNQQINLKFIVVILVGLYGLNLVNIIFNSLENYIFSIITENTNYILKNKIIYKASKVSLEKFEKHEFYNQLQLANQSISRNGIQVIQNIFIILQQIISLIAVYGLLAAVHWSLPLALLFSTLPGIILLFIVKKSRFEVSVETTPIVREMEYNGIILTNREFAREVRLFELQEHLIFRWSNLYNIVKKLRIKQAFVEFKGGGVGASILQISALLVAILLVAQIQKGNLTLGDYVALLGSVVTVQGIFTSIGSSIGNIAEVAIYNNALFSFLDLEENELEPSIKFNLNNFNEIRVENICFEYPNSSRGILDQISFVIKKGEKIAIVGDNGAGKTTLVNCLLGLYTITNGNIYYGQDEISTINKKSLNKKVAVVFQDFVKYMFSVRENVGFGDYTKLSNDKEIKRVLNKVRMIELINKFPLQLDTPLGKEFESGQSFSGGEWQRIAIARALIRDAEIIILDEPTAALDPMSELQIFKCFSQLTENKTSIIISHRLGPARYADKILVLEQGRLVEQGSHSELVALGGKYANMYQAQAQWYQEDVKVNTNTVEMGDLVG